MYLSLTHYFQIEQIAFIYNFVNRIDWIILECLILEHLQILYHQMILKSEHVKSLLLCDIRS